MARDITNIEYKEREELIDQLARINDYIAEHFPDDYHADEDTADCVIGILTRLSGSQSYLAVRWVKL